MAQPIGVNSEPRELLHESMKILASKEAPRAWQQFRLTSPADRPRFRDVRDDKTARLLTSSQQRAALRFMAARNLDAHVCLLSQSLRKLCDGRLTAAHGRLRLQLRPTAAMVSATSGSTLWFCACRASG